MARTAAASAAERRPQQRAAALMVSVDGATFGDRPRAAM